MCGNSGMRGKSIERGRGREEGERGGGEREGGGGTRERERERERERSITIPGVTGKPHFDPEKCLVLIFCEALSSCS